MNTVEILHNAAARLVCEHRHPCQPPHGSIANPGDCSMWGAPFGAAPVADPLCEPLAGLLNAVAGQITAFGIHRDHWRTRGCGRPVSPHGSMVYPDSCVCPAVLRAVDVARLIAGGAL